MTASRPLPTARRTAVLGLTAVATAVGLVVGATPAVAAPPDPPIPVGWPAVSSATSTARVTVAPGVTSFSETYRTTLGPEHTQVLDVDLARRGVRLDTVESHDHLYDPPDEPTSSMGDRTGAVAGINGDYFAIHAAGTPLGGVVRDGRLLKSPRAGFAAQFVLGTDGRARIGTTGFTGSVRDGSATTAVTSLNTLTDAAAGGVSELTPDLGAATTATAGTLAVGVLRRGVLRVEQVLATTATLPALAHDQRALFGAGAGGRWLAAHVRAGDRLHVVARLTDRHVHALVSGATVLVRDGAVFTDPTGQPPGGRNPETMIGLSRDGRHALLVVIDGRQPTASVGVTVTEAAQYLVAHGAWSGLLLDGGGSSTLAARLPGTASLSVLNTPSDPTGERPVANGLFVYRH